jgi:hypothetical protein
VNFDYGIHHGLFYLADNGLDDRFTWFTWFAWLAWLEFPGLLEVASEAVCSKLRPCRNSSGWVPWLLASGVAWKTLF